MLRRLETRVPPPLLLLLLGVALWCAVRASGWRVASPALQGLGLFVMLAGVALNLQPKRGFRRAGTTVNPLRPQAAKRLVIGGLYRYSRNPMYLGHVLALAGWGLWLQSGLVLPALIVQVAWLQWLQVRPEERALQARFGADYDAYRARVRRWL
jgi:protein-S-isoprenylcysteine O-methyltransferase Ste14